MAEIRALLHTESDPETLVERLWTLARSFEVIDETTMTVTYSDGAILVESAQEIDRLRKEVRRLRNEILKGCECRP